MIGEAPYRSPGDPGTAPKVEPDPQVRAFEFIKDLFENQTQGFTRVKELQDRLHVLEGKVGSLEAFKAQVGSMLAGALLLLLIALASIVVLLSGR